MLSKLVTTYVDESLAQRRRLGLTQRKAFPRSTVTDAELDELEESLGAALPPLYRDLLKYAHWDRLGTWGLTFEPHVARQWRKQLERLVRSSWLPERIIGRGLVPFGSECFMDAGPVCFDTRARLPDGDCSVVLWDHEWVGTRREVQPLFSSSARMFECMTFVARHDLEFFHHDPEEDDREQLPKKRKLLEEFLAIDPSGAGRRARAYWTSWGVRTERRR